jgi:hypothetical protein
VGRRGYAQALERAREGVIDASFHRVSSQQLSGLLDAAPRDLGPRLVKADFTGAVVSGYAGFEGATFGGRAGFDGATFAEGDRATFGGRAGFVGATFAGEAQFGGATCREDVSCRKATFERATVLGPIHVFERLWLDEVVFAQRVRIEASASRASFARAAFHRGADLRLRWAELWLEDSDFAEPSLITGLQARLNPRAADRSWGGRRRGTAARGRARSATHPTGSCRVCCPCGERGSRA